MSGLPMSSDTAHVFSGGALSERAGLKPWAGQGPGGAGAMPAPRSESVTHYEAAPALGGTGDWRVLELPACREVARYPTLEAAQAYALALNNWLAARPDPSHVAAFFDGRVREEPSYEGLLAILARGERPERIGLEGR